MKMLKRGFSLFLSVCLLPTLVACGGGMTAEERTAFDNLQQQVTELQTELSAHDVHDTAGSASAPTPSENDSSDTTSASAPSENNSHDTTSASTPGAEPATSSEAALQTAITQQLASDKFVDWLAVAKCENATEENMMALARNVSTCQDWYDYTNSYDAYDVIDALDGSASCTDEVLGTIRPGSFRAAYIIAGSAHAGERALSAAIRTLVDLDDWYDYTNSYDAYDVIDAIANNPNVTLELMTELAQVDNATARDTAHKVIEKLS